MDTFSIFFNMKVYCVFSLVIRNEYTQYTIFNIKKKNTLNYPKSAAWDFFNQRTKERVRSSSGK